MGGREPECRAHRSLGTWCWQHPNSRRMRRGYMASSSLCVDDLTAEPPAHCRLDPTTICFKIVVSLNSIPNIAAGAIRIWGQTTRSTIDCPWPVLLFGRGRSFVPALRRRGARRAAQVKDGRLAARRGLSLTAASTVRRSLMVQMRGMSSPTSGSSSTIVRCCQNVPFGGWGTVLIPRSLS
jgi:hypothetical protein